MDGSGNDGLGASIPSSLSFFSSEAFFSASLFNKSRDLSEDVRIPDSSSDPTVLSVSSGSKISELADLGSNSAFGLNIFGPPSSDSPLTCSDNSLFFIPYAERTAEIELDLSSFFESDDWPTPS